MPTTYQTSSAQQMWSEMQRLEEAVAHLQARLEEYSAESSHEVQHSVPISLDETPAVVEEEDPWSVWPYCWFIQLHRFARQGFHSFHQNLDTWQLRRHNQQMQQAFLKTCRRQAAPHMDETTASSTPLRLV